MLTGQKEFDKNKEENWKREALSFDFSIVGWDEVKKNIDNAKDEDPE